MWRTQTIAAFAGAIIVSMLFSAAPAIAGDLSLIAYDNRGVQEPEQQGQPCQSCSDVHADYQNGMTASGPMILNLGPPPRLYSPSADFGSRVETTTSGWSIVGDTGTTASSDQLHCASSTPPLTTTAQPIIYSPPQPIRAAGPSPATISWYTWPVSAPVPPAPAAMAVYPHPMIGPPTGAAPTVYYPSAATMPLCASFANDCGATCSGSVGCQCAPCDCTAALQCASCDCSSSGNDSAQCHCEAPYSADQLQHVLAAIQHLDAAGLKTEADELRQQCNAELSATIARLKASETTSIKLQPTPHTPSANEAWHPASASGSQKSVKITAQVMQLNLSKCERLGIHIADNAAMLLNRLEMLKQNGALEVVSAPTILTVSGNPASIHLGNAAPAAVKDSDEVSPLNAPKFGTELTIRPTVQTDNTVRLQIHCSVNTSGVSDTARFDGNFPPSIESRDIQTTVDVQSGKSALLSTQRLSESQVVVELHRQQGADGKWQDQIVKEMRMVPSNMELLVLVRPEIVGQETATASNHPCEPVVSAALPISHGTQEPSDFVTQAGYFVPETDFGRLPNDSDILTPPTPFEPQPVTIETIDGGAGTSTTWDALRPPEPFTDSPAMFGGYIFTPDKR